MSPRRNAVATAWACDDAPSLSCARLECWAIVCGEIISIVPARSRLTPWLVRNTQASSRLLNGVGSAIRRASRASAASRLSGSAHASTVVR